jgi:hypothetical protein
MQTNQYHMATRPLRRATAALLLLAVIAGCASMQPAQPQVQVPDKLKAGADEKLAMIVPARGVQIYECRAKKDQSGEYEWAFVAPEAELLGANGNKIGKHYAGPHWEANDGSRIVGAVKANSPAPGADAIAWLLLGAKSVGPAGAFSSVTSVQRVNTVGGIAPKTGCSQATAGASARINYTADYYFLTRK